MTPAEVREALAYLRAVHALLDWSPAHAVPRHCAYRVGSRGARSDQPGALIQHRKKLETFFGGSGAQADTQEQKVTPSPGS